MPQEIEIETGEQVEVMCFNFHNPQSVNGPFGTFELWLEGNNLLGRMTMTLLFGLPSNTYLNLTGTASGTSTHTCALEGKGYMQRLGSQPVRADFVMTVTLDASWTHGSLSFSQGFFGVSGGLPVQRTPCKSA